MPSAPAACLPQPGTSRPRWRILIIPSLLFCVIFGFTFAPLLREIPDTASARAGFHDLTRHPATEVQEIYFFERNSQGIESFLRFTYPDEPWVDRFLRGGELQSTPGLQPGGYDIASWWNNITLWQLSEFYHMDERLSSKYWIWVDRPHRYMYIYSYSTPREEARVTRPVKNLRALAISQVRPLSPLDDI